MRMDVIFLWFFTPVIIKTDQLIHPLDRPNQRALLGALVADVTVTVTVAERSIGLICCGLPPRFLRLSVYRNTFLIYMFSPKV